MASTPSGFIQKTDVDVVVKAAIQPVNREEFTASEKAYFDKYHKMIDQRGRGANIEFIKLAQTRLATARKFQQQEIDNFENHHRTMTRIQVQGAERRARSTARSIEVEKTLINRAQQAERTGGGGGGGFGTQVRRWAGWAAIAAGVGFVKGGMSAFEKSTVAATDLARRMGGRGAEVGPAAAALRNRAFAGDTMMSQSEIVALQAQMESGGGAAAVGQAAQVATRVRGLGMDPGALGAGVAGGVRAGQTPVAVLQTIARLLETMGQDERVSRQEQLDAFTSVQASNLTVMRTVTDAQAATTARLLASLKEAGPGLAGAGGARFVQTMNEFLRTTTHPGIQAPFLEAATLDVARGIGTQPLFQMKKIMQRGIGNEDVLNVFRGMFKQFKDDPQMAAGLLTTMDPRIPQDLAEGFMEQLFDPESPLNKEAKRGTLAAPQQLFTDADFIRRQKADLARKKEDAGKTTSAVIRATMGLFGLGAGPDVTTAGRIEATTRANKFMRSVSDTPGFSKMAESFPGLMDPMGGGARMERGFFGGAGEAFDVQRNEMATRHQAAGFGMVAHLARLKQQLEPDDFQTIFNLTKGLGDLPIRNRGNVTGREDMVTILESINESVIANPEALAKALEQYIKRLNYTFLKPKGPPPTPDIVY